MLHFTTLLSLFVLSSAQWINPGDNGFATMSHYGDLSSSVVAACGCTPGSANHPTAAMSQMAFGSSSAFGPQCGKCFNLTLLNTFLSDPPWVLQPNQTKSVVVKITDLCPLSKDGWCSGNNEGRVNDGGHNINFDLSFPSPGIPADFYPVNETFYGYNDFGVWNISYAAVSCDSWAGTQDQNALGKVPEGGPEGYCCPANPTAGGNNTCGSHSSINGGNPFAMPGGSGASALESAPWAAGFVILAAALAI